VTKRRSDVPVFLLYAGILHAIGLAVLLPMLITLPGPSEPTPAPAATASPEIAPIEVIVLPPPKALKDAGPEHTSAVPSAPSRGVSAAAGTAEPATAEPSRAEPPGAEAQGEQKIEAAPEQKEAAPEPKQVAPEPNEAAPEPQSAPVTEATGSRETKPSESEGAAAGKPPKDDAPAKKAAPAKESTNKKEAAPAAIKASAAQRSRTAKPALRRTPSRTARSQTKFQPFNGALSGWFTPSAKQR
jgi:hypothetical protein